VVIETCAKFPCARAPLIYGDHCYFHSGKLPRSEVHFKKTFTFGEVSV
jgi:hypothetical protein